MIREASLLPPFIPLATYVRWTGALLLASMALAWIAVGVDLAELRLLFRATGGTQVGALEREAQFLTRDWMRVLQLVLFVATASAFLMWLYQARANLRALAVRRPAYTRGWVVGGFFAPLLNLFRPYQVVREIWQASDPDYLDPFNWKTAPATPLLGAWWLLCVAWALLELVAFTTALGAGASLARLQLSVLVATGADLLAGLAAGAAYLLVGRLSEAQDEKYARQLAATKASA